MTKIGKTQRGGSPEKTAAKQPNPTASTTSAKPLVSTAMQSASSFVKSDFFPPPEGDSPAKESARSDGAIELPFGADAILAASRASGLVIGLPDPSLPIEAQSDEVLLAMCLHGEARGEGLVGMFAAGMTVINRKNDPTQRSYLGCKKDGTRLRDVILYPFAYSSFNANDPNRAKLLRPNKGRWVDAAIVAAALISGILPDPTDGSTHYHTIAKPSYATIWPPKWASHPKMVRTVKVGRHIFYREEP